MPIKESLDIIEAQTAFAHYLAQALLWCRNRGWAITLGEGMVAMTDAADGDHDGPHKKGGQHYRALANDCNLWKGGSWLKIDEHGLEVYRGGDLITKGGSEEWRELGEFFESLHPRCFWGGRIGDDNHLGFRWGGRA